MKRARVRQAAGLALGALGVSLVAALMSAGRPHGRAVLLLEDQGFAQNKRSYHGGPYQVSPQLVWLPKRGPGGRRGRDREREGERGIERGGERTREGEGGRERRTAPSAQHNTFRAQYAAPSLPLPTGMAACDLRVECRRGWPLLT